MKFIALYRGPEGEICYVNISADSADEDGNFVKVFHDGAPVGSFDLGFIEAWYLSEGSK